MKHVNIPIFIPQLGCPHQCIYCNQKTISAQTSIPNEKQVREQISRCFKSIGPKVDEVEIAYFGGSFTSLPMGRQKTYLEAARPFLKHPKFCGVRISARPDCIDEEELHFLKTFGVKTIELGIQSFADVVLKASGRLYSSIQAMDACHMVKSKGFRLGVQVMAGLPEDNYRFAIQTAEHIAAIKPDMVRIYPALIIKDTPLEQMYERRMYKPLTLDEAVRICADMNEIISRENITIIRMGLQTNEELRSGEVIAGPFHPAFGELVEQKIFFRRAQRQLEKYYSVHKRREPLAFIVNPKDISKMIGHKRSNIDLLSRTWKEPLTVIGRENQKKGAVAIERL